MKKTYFVLGEIYDSMFNDVESEILIGRKVLSPSDAKEVIKDGVISCANRGDWATLSAMHDRFGIQVLIPDLSCHPNDILLSYGDRVLVMSVSGLPALATDNEIKSAVFRFSLYTVIDYVVVP